MGETFDSGCLSRIIRAELRKTQTIGAAVGVLKNNERVYSKGFGCRNLAQQQAMTPDTLVGYASVTKSFTALAILLLEEKVELSIADSVSSYLPAAPFLDHPEITLKHLLSHSSGIPNMEACEIHQSCASNETFDVSPVVDREELLAHIGDVKAVVFPPGERFMYNNDLYVCLGFIIEDISGVSFSEFIEENILKPLLMCRSTMSSEGLMNDSESNVITGYKRQDGPDGHLAECELVLSRFLLPAGGLYTSANEILNYAECLVNGGEFRGKQVFSPEIIDRLFTPSIATYYGTGKNPQYCLGWIYEPKTDDCPALIRHGGGMDTSGSELILIPELRSAITVATNGYTGVTFVIADVALEVLQNRSPEDNLWSLKVADALKAVTGTYSLPHENATMKVETVERVLKGTISFRGRDSSQDIVLTLSFKDLDDLVFSVYSNAEHPKGFVEFFRDDVSGKISHVLWDRVVFWRN